MQGIRGFCLFRVAFLFALASTLPAASLVEQALDSLRWRHPLPQGNDLYSAAYGNGRYVMVGRRGVVVTSTDGTHWAARNDQRSNDLLRVTFANGKFVAVGNFGAIFVSTNGLDWQNRSIPTHDPLVSIAYGNGTWVVGTWLEQRIYVADEQFNWTSRAVASWDVAFGAGRFVAVSAGTGVSTSTDGRNWTPVTLPSSPFSVRAITYGNGRFVLGADQYSATSPDGLNWTERTGGGFCGEVAAGPGSFLRLTGGGGTRYSRPYSREVLYSTDGLSWTQVLNYSNYIFGIAFVHDRYVAMGNNGVWFSSPDGITWTQATYGTENNFRAVAYGNHRYVAVGNQGYVFTSDDGSEWLQRQAFTTKNVRGVIYAQDMFVAVAGGDIVRSRDGENWSTVYQGTYDLLNIAYAAGTFVAVGDRGTILTSSNGNNWHQRNTSRLEDLQGIAYGEGLFMVTGRRNVILSSPDAANWTLRYETNASSYLQTAAYGNGRLVAMGNEGVIVVWDQSTNSPVSYQPTFNEFEHVIFAAGHFVAVGEDGTVLSSTNGMTWRQHYCGSHNNLRAVTYAQGAFTIVGNNDVILQSGQVQPFLRINAPLDGTVQVHIRAMPNNLYRLQGSWDLRTWEDVFIFQNSREDTVFLDDQAAQRIYRVAFEP